MKNFLSLIALTLIVFNTQVAAQGFSLEDELRDYNQVGKINAVMLNQIDDNINAVKVNFDLERENADGGFDHMEGKILAALILTIEDQLDAVDEQRRLLDEKYEILDANKEAIDNRLQGIQILIDEINL